MSSRWMANSADRPRAQPIGWVWATASCAREALQVFLRIRSTVAQMIRRSSASENLIQCQLNGVVGFLVPWILAFVSYCDTILYSDRHIAIQNHQQVLATEVQWPPSVTNTWNDRVYIASRRNEVLTSLGLELFFDQ